MIPHLLYLNGGGEKGTATAIPDFIKEEWIKDLVGKTSIRYYVL